MRLLFTIVALVLMTAPLFSQTTYVELCPYPDIDEKDLKTGDPTGFCWSMPWAPDLLFFRIYRSQSQAGSWDVWKKIPYDEATMKKEYEGKFYTMVIYDFPADIRTYRYRITAVYAVVKDGMTTMKETTSSAEVKITIIP
jgi:hypothetical protein